MMMTNKLEIIFNYLVTFYIDIISATAGVALKKTVERRVAQQRRELSLAVVLTLTVVMFLVTHVPRWSHVLYHHHHNSRSCLLILRY